MKKDMFVVGGGIIGLFSAYYLHESGHQVILADKGNLSDNCSVGNAGLIVPSHIIPLASPGMVSSALKHLLDPGASFGVKMPPSLEFLRWALRFLRSSRPEVVRESSVILKDLAAYSQDLYRELAEKQNIPFRLEKKGLLIACKSEKVLKSETDVARLAGELGLGAEVLSGERIRSMEPALFPGIPGGIYYPGDCNVHPGSLMKELSVRLENTGVTILRNATVSGITKADTVLINDRSYRFDALVIAAGARSNDLVRMLGRKVSMQPGRGYSFDTKNYSGIRYPALLNDDHISVTPFGDGRIRFGGAMEIGYSRHGVTGRRIRGILQLVRRNYPSFPPLRPEDLKIWNGLRPCSFDGLPFIGRLPGNAPVYLATGHSMLGVTLAPGTGKLISQLINGEPPSLNLLPFRADR